ncbi:MAG: hypothetical protein CM15mP65_29040 [Crocinitomicaceae bacterium]|nr:MAG: hypothetical protein CM15mP65_29040 [Crocinitomicaceae bacterium]
MFYIFTIDIYKSLSLKIEGNLLQEISNNNNRFLWGIMDPNKKLGGVMYQYLQNVQHIATCCCSFFFNNMEESKFKAAISTLIVGLFLFFQTWG